jgi:membrane fusion protein, copper/silver efflux system
MKKALIFVAVITVACGSESGRIGAVSCGGGGGTAAPAAGSRLPASIVDPYLDIQSALAQDRADEVRAKAGEIATAATSLGAPAMKIDTAAVQLASAGDVADARQKFGTLSDAVVAYMDGVHLKAPDGVRTAYCPMAKKSWLQKGDTLANPYYGTSMPTCGEFK